MRIVLVAATLMIVNRKPLRYPMRIFSVAVAVSGLISVAENVRAAESVFGFAYTADSLPEGAVEGYSRLTHRWDKGEGSFHANDIRIGFDKGVTDRFEYGFWLQGLNMRGNNAFPPSADGGEVFPFHIKVDEPLQSIGGEVRYNFLSPYKDAFGISVLTELYHVRYYAKVDGARTKQWSLEPHLILQKNFFEDQLITVYNLAIESERRVFPEDNAKETEFSITHNVGVSYHIAPKFYAGIEARHHMDIVNGEKNHNDFFVGPTVLYSEQNWHIQLSYLRQLRGNPTYSGYEVQPDSEFFDIDTGLHLEEDVKNEFRFKIGFEF